jgi:hypothetical protein
MSGVYRGFGARHPAQAFGLRRAVFQRDLLPEPVGTASPRPLTSRFAG